MTISERSAGDAFIVKSHRFHPFQPWSRKDAVTIPPAGAVSEPARDRTVTRTVTLLAGLAALVIAAAPPAASFLAARDRLDGVLETSARLHAAEVAILAPQTPGFWDFDALHLTAPDEEAGGTIPERRRVYDVTGRLVLESAPARDLAWPVMSHSAPIMDGATRLGQAVASRSFRQALIMSLLVALVSALGGILIFVVLRVVPLRLLQQAQDRAVYLSSHDVLTGLPNRAVFGDRLRQAQAGAHRTGGLAAILCLDLDRFKFINDTLGHAAGDIVLRTVALRLRACLRAGDTLARLGGDEFAVILPTADSALAIESLAARLIEAVERPIDIDGAAGSVGVSIGIAFGEPGLDQDQWLQNADVALYQVKSSGRGQWCVFTHGMNDHLRESRALAAALRVAVAEQQFFLHYQPQVCLDGGRLVGAEALVRWDRPGSGLVSPARFIGVAEETGLIGAIGAWVLHQACQTAARWPETLGIAVNVSPMQFRLPHFHETVVEALAASGLAPSRLELEITEGMLLSDTTETLVILNGLRALGVKLAMDDFGTGYSSLGYLQKFHFDKIKIDLSFVRRLGTDPEAAAIVRAILALSKAMGVTTIAEGVETWTQANILRDYGCEVAQGYLYGRPMASDAFAGLIGGTVAREALFHGGGSADALDPAAVEG
jgi:diguanylate cyclase (GGDEF)-like protein